MSEVGTPRLNCDGVYTWLTVASAIFQRGSYFFPLTIFSSAVYAELIFVQSFDKGFTPDYTLSDKTPISIPFTFQSVTIGSQKGIPASGALDEFAVYDQWSLLGSDHDEAWILSWLTSALTESRANSVIAFVRLRHGGSMSLIPRWLIILLTWTERFWSLRDVD